MRLRMSTCLALAAVIMLNAAVLVSAQAPGASDAARQRTLFLQRNYEVAVIEGARLDAPRQPEATAWQILNLSRAGREDDAIAAARELTARAPRDGWSWLALAGALHYKGRHLDDATSAAAKALELMPANLYAVWMRGHTLSGDPARWQEAVTFVDSQLKQVSNPALLLLVKAYVLYSQSLSPRDEAKMNAAFATLEDAQRLDPSSVSAFYLHGTYLESQRRPDDAYPRLKRAVALAPDSTPVREAYWTSIRNSRQFDAEEKRAEIERDVAAFLEENHDRPGALSAVWNIARGMKLEERRQEMEAAILSRFNDSPEAEWVLVERRRQLNAPAQWNSPERRRMLTEYVARPRHYHTGLLGEAYRDLFFVLVEDPAVSSDELIRVADGMLKYETTNPHITRVAAPIVLADRKRCLPDAERIARSSLEALSKPVESRRSTFKSEGEYEQARDRMQALGHDAIGWVLFAQGQVAEAEKELLRSHDLHRENRDNLHHLGRLFEARGDIARAEDYYVKGLAIQGRSVNPSEAALRALYEKRQGGIGGFDGYVDVLRGRDRAVREEKILGERIAQPAAVPAFALNTLDGRRLALPDFKGKIVVINFWGIWCGPCVREMPDVQKLHTQYVSDPDVLVLTIDNDRNPDDVAPWMKERTFTFPVLLDDGYVSKAGIHAFPTTWFLDRDGRKVFEKRGWSEKLVEEFSWRIEAIRGGSVAK